MKKHYYLIVDTETTFTRGEVDTVADFGAVIIDRQNRVIESLGVLVTEEADKNLHFALGNPKETKKKYQLLLNAGKRSYMTVAEINDWLEMIALKYLPVLTAYNIGFDMGKCRNTGIYLDQFDQRFCLWGASKATICLDQEYARRFLVSNLVEQCFDIEDTHKQCHYCATVSACSYCFSSDFSSSSLRETTEFGCDCCYTHI